MFLILCNEHDPSAWWALRQLQALGLAPLRLVTAEALVRGPSFRHWVGTDGAGASVRLPDGEILDHDAVWGVLNRIAAVPPAFVGGAAEEDRGYAAEELYAVLLSWLHALPGRVLNPPSPRGLCGAWLAPSEWAFLAGAAGLPQHPVRQGSREAVTRQADHQDDASSTLIVDGQVFATPEIPDGIAAACARLAGLAETPLLGVRLVRGEQGEWSFTGATPLPDLRDGDPALFAALAAALAESAP